MGTSKQAAKAASARPAKWDRLLSSTPSTGDLAKLRANPGTKKMLQTWCAKALAFHDQDKSTTASHPDAAAIVFGNLALLLHGTGGLTHTRLREASAGMKLMSPGRASAILFRLQRIGYIQPARRRRDGKVGLYVPSAKMVDDYRKRFRIGMEALAETIAPEIKPVLDRLDDHEVFIKVLVYFATLTTMAFAHMTEDLAAFYALVERNAAMLIVMGLLTDADTKAVFPKAGVRRVSISALSKRFEISRTQVRRQLGKMEESGFIKRQADGKIHITTRLCRTFERYFLRIALGLVAISYRMLQEFDLTQTDRPSRSATLPAAA